MRRWMRAVVLVAVGALGLIGCQREETYELAPYLVGVQGEGRFLCMHGTEVETGELNAFCEGIGGFTFRWGVSQTVRVSVEELENPPADGSSLRYTLEEVLETEPVPEGTTFELRLDGEYLAGNRTSGYSLLDRLPLTCAATEVCDALGAKQGTSQQFSLELGYPSTEGGPLSVKRVF